MYREDVQSGAAALVKGNVRQDFDTASASASGQGYGVLRMEIPRLELWEDPANPFESMSSMHRRNCS
jgi:hypothetical protein